MVPKPLPRVSITDKEDLENIYLRLETMKHCLNAASPSGTERQTTYDLYRCCPHKTVSRDPQQTGGKATLTAGP